MVGVLPAFVAALGFAAFQTINRRALSGVDVYRGTATVLAMGTLLLVSLSFALHGASGFLDAPPIAYAYFGSAGLVHFFLGWTLLGVSQLRLGAARAGIVVGTLPLFGAIVAAFALDEPLSPIDVLGLILVVAGVGLVIPARAAPPAASQAARQAASQAPRTGASAATSVGRGLHGPRGVAWGVAAGLATALCWSVSPVLIRGGLEHVVSPIAGAAIGLAAAATVYAAAIALTAGGRTRRARIEGSTRRLLVGAGAAVAVGISMQWTAYDLAPIAVVLSVLQFTPPLVVLLAVVVSREPLGERAWKVWAGSFVTLAGALVLILL